MLIMQFQKSEKYSIDNIGFFYQISQDEFVHCSLFYTKYITWMKGTKRTERPFVYDVLFGVVGNSFYFIKDGIIKKAELCNNQVVIIDSFKIEQGLKYLCNSFFLHYFIERDNNPNVVYAIAMGDYRSNHGIKFNISIDELKKYKHVNVYGDFLFGISRTGNSSSIRRHRSDSEETLEKKELPMMYGQPVIFNNRIFYLTVQAELISVNMNDFSHEIMKTNLDRTSLLVGIDENGTVNAQTQASHAPGYILTAKLPEKYTVS